MKEPPEQESVESFAQHNIPPDIKNSVSRLVPHFHDLLSNATIQGNTKDVLPEPWTSHSQVFSSQPNAPPAVESYVGQIAETLSYFAQPLVPQHTLDSLFQSLRHI